MNCHKNILYHCRAEWDPNYGIGLKCLSEVHVEVKVTKQSKAFFQDKARRCCPDAPDRWTTEPYHFSPKPYTTLQSHQHCWENQKHDRMLKRSCTHQLKTQVPETEKETEKESYRTDCSLCHDLKTLQTTFTLQLLLFTMLSDKL